MQDRPLSGGSWTTHNFYHSDANGNITYMINSAQTMVASYKYDPFGRIESQSGSMATDNVYRFSSKEALFKTTFAGGPSELYYYGYRFYDAQTGRWLNRDPIAENGGLNLYAAFDGNPINAFDAFGNDATTRRMLRELGKVVIGPTGALGLGLGLNEIVIGYYVDDHLKAGECVYLKTRLSRVLSLAVTGVGEIVTRYCKDCNGNMQAPDHVWVQTVPRA